MCQNPSCGGQPERSAATPGLCPVCDPRQLSWLESEEHEDETSYFWERPDDHADDQRQPKRRRK